METSDYTTIEYPNKNIQNKVDYALENCDNFKIIIIGKFHKWLANKTLPCVINKDKEVSVIYTLLSAILCMNLHQVTGSVNLFNQYNKTHQYKMMYTNEGSITFTCKEVSDDANAT